MPNLTSKSTRARWTIEHDRATHDSGVIIHFPGGRIEAPDATINAIKAKHGGHNLPVMLNRLRREAFALAGLQQPKKST